MSVSRAAPREGPTTGKRRGGSVTRWRPRWSLTHLVMVAAGLIAFVATLTALRDREAVVEIPVASIEIAAGETIEEDAIGLATARAPSPDLTAAVLSPEELLGRVAARNIPAAAIVSAADLVEPGEETPQRTMSVEAAAFDGVAGTLGRGDLVDIVAVIDDQAMFAATGVEVVGVVAEGRGAGGGVSVVIAIDAVAGLRLAWASSRSNLHFVKVSGADPANAAAVYPESEVTDDGR